ncbi:MAG: fimbrillin family protein [Rikenellaceae bacterium]
MKNITYLLLTLALCAGCSDSENENENENASSNSEASVEKGSAVVFNVDYGATSDASVTSLGVELSPVFKSTLEISDYVGISAINAGGEVSDLNTKYFCNGDGTTVATVISNSICYPKSGTINAVAYTPYDLDYSYEGGLTLSIADQSDLEAIDFACSDLAKDLSDNGESVNMTLNHLLTAILFKVEAGDGIEPESLDYVTFTIEGLNTQANITFGEEVNYTFSKMSNIVMNTTDTPGYAKALVFPEYITNSTVYLRIKYDGGEIYSGLKQLLGGGNSQLASATIRSCTATINRDGVTFTADAKDGADGNTIIDWSEGEVADDENGSAYEF